MPPSQARQQPTQASARPSSTGFGAGRGRSEAQSGDPGPVLARRLSNAEYDYTIRDLTGVDIRPTQEFPVDPANEAGFDNSAESLTMSPALVKKYLEAGRRVADHLVLKPGRLRLRARTRCSPTPTATSTASARSSTSTSGSRPTTPTISSPPGGIAHRAALGQPDATPGRLRRRDAGSAAKYLATIWSTLTAPAERRRPDRRAPGAVARACRCPRIASEPRRRPAPAASGCATSSSRSAAGSSPERQEPDRPRDRPRARSRFVLWKNRQFAANRMRYAGNARRRSRICRAGRARRPRPWR